MGTERRPAQLWKQAEPPVSARYLTDVTLWMITA
jgi:hypothetical protein